MRTTADIFRLVPFLVIILIPFAELALPLLLKIFPNLLPSTFQDQMKQEARAASGENPHPPPAPSSF